MSKRILSLSLALCFVALVFLIAALQIPRIGEGAPDWHTVKRPQIPVQSLDADSSPPPIPQHGNADVDASFWNESAHPPIAFLVARRICVSEPVYGWRYDCGKMKWVKVCLGTHAVVKYVKKQVTAHWIDSMRCYGFYDDYGCLRLVPDFR